MAAKKAIDKLVEALAPLGATKDSFSDGSGSWVSLEDTFYEICFSFDPAGKKIERIMVSKKIYQVVNQESICQIKTT